jgi:serine/threonine-protein kinase
MTGEGAPDNGPGDGDGRTVFVPGAEGSGDGTVFVPGQSGRPATQDLARAKGIKVGDVLNHIFEVRRFIARGGMGEVFEGANVITHERVAIKVMLPALAADEHVITLFHREARTLTHLHHEAVVQYRVLAQEPQLGVLYIVTEYIDGTNLGDMLGALMPSPEELIALLRRLASGLQAAHVLGAVHRDISPDNILLGDGRLDRAKIIDFGIAKDLDPGTATIVGDGFAGKLGYVAPEQIGDFGRRLGPWTDVYSLGLVMLAIAGGRDVDMGGTLVDAVDKRRAGPDLSVAPPQLRPLLERMTRADPAERLGSMDAVLAELAALDRPTSVSVSRQPWLIPAAAIALLIIVGLVLALTLGHYGSNSGKRRADAATPGDPVQAATVAVDAALPSVSCTWLNIAGIRPKNGRLQVALTGVAGDPSAAQNEIGRTLASQNIANADLDFAQVSPITPAGCAALDAYRQIGSPNPDRLTVPQRQFEMRLQPAGKAYAGKRAANAVIGINVADPTLDFALVGLEPSGKIDMLIPSRAAFAEQVRQSQGGVPISDLGRDRYRLQLDLDHLGWSGLLLMTGKGPFDAEVVAPPLGARGADWRDKLVQRAAEGNWQATMVWFKSVNEGSD